MNLQRATAIKHFFVVVGLNGLCWAKCLKKQNTKARIMLFLRAKCKVKFGNEDKQELDVVFLPIGKEPIVVECKSGNSDETLKNMYA